MRARGPRMHIGAPAYGNPRTTRCGDDGQTDRGTKKAHCGETNRVERLRQRRFRLCGDARRSCPRLGIGRRQRDLSSNEYYEIEKLLDQRTNPITGVVEYLVKWEGYSNDENTWEPEPRLIEDDNEELIKEWRQAQTMKSPELRAAKIQLLSKLRARHVTPTLGKPLESDDFVSYRSNERERQLRNTGDAQSAGETPQMYEEELSGFSLDQASQGVQAHDGAIRNVHGVDNVSAQNYAESNDDDEGKTMMTMAICFQTQDDEAFGVTIGLEQGNLPVPGTSIKRSRRLQPEDFCTPRDTTSPKLSDATATQRRSSSDAVIKEKPDNTVSPFFSVKTSAPKSSLLFSGSRKSPLKPQQTVKRKYNTGVSASTNAVKKRKTPLFSLPSSVILNQKSPLRDRSKMRNSFLNMGKKFAKTSSSKTLFGRK